MSQQISQGTVGAASAKLGNLVIPPGPCTLALSNAGSASPVWIAVGGTGVTPANGFPLPSGVSPLVMQFYQGNQGGVVYAVASAGGGTANVGYWLSTATGQTGL